MLGFEGPPWRSLPPEKVSLIEPAEEQGVRGSRVLDALSVLVLLGDETGGG